MDECRQKLSENLEDYLEAIASLEAKHGTARPTDIAKAMSVKKPSVTAALNALAERGLVEYEKYKPVTLTKEGRAVADSVRRKHELLSSFFTDELGVNASSADMAACKMEHALEDGIMRKLIKFLKTLGRGEAAESAVAEASEMSELPEIFTLDLLPAGVPATVISVGARIGKIGAFAGIGLVSGAVVEIVRDGPFGDPVLLKVNDTEIALRRKQMKFVKVKRV